MPSAETPEGGSDTLETSAPVSSKVSGTATLSQGQLDNNVKISPEPGSGTTAADLSTKPTIQAANTATTAPGEAKLSNAELKQRAKAEKQAKRAQKKADAETGPAVKAPPSTQQQRKANGPPPTPKADSAPNFSAPKQQAKQGQAQSKGIPHRPPPGTEKGPPEKITENKNVALFGHLYTHPRRTTIAGVSKDVHPAVLALGLQMSNYVICGSSARCVATLMAFKRIIESYVTPPGTSLPRNLTALLSPQIEYLVSCRPLSVSTGNAIRWLKLLINDVDIEAPEEKVKLELCEAIDNFIREKITIADQLIATTASSKIKNGDTILTYAKSNVVAKTLLQAHAAGTIFKVIIIDSRPLFEGKNLARKLVNAGLNVQYSLTHATSHLMQSVTKVLLGAHALFSNGRLYSRIGTAIVAMTANNLAKPVIVCCESIKFTDRIALDSIVANEVVPPDELLLPEHQSWTGNGVEDENQDGNENKSQGLASWNDLPNLQLLDLMYDVTPADYIDMVITEYGSLPPSSVMSIYRLSTST